MLAAAVTQLIPVLQTAIGPTILISGVGLLLLTMTNRLGRAIDRSRALAGTLAKATETDRPKIEGQLKVLWRRARLIRLTIALAAMSALSAAVLILVLFVTALGQIDSAELIGALFFICLGCLIGALSCFIQDINLSLAALKLELGNAIIE